MSAATASPETPAPDVSAPGRVVGTFFSPGPTFRSIAARPTFLLPLILWTACSLLITALILPRLDVEKMIRQTLEKRGQTVPEDRIQSIVSTQRKVIQITTVVFGALTPTLISLLVALVYWASFKAFGWDFTYRQGLGATTHSFLPGVLGALLLVPVILQRQTLDPRGMGELLQSNLGFLVDKSSSAMLHSLLQSIDVFSLWSLVLLTIGLSAAARVSRKAAGGVVFAIWFIYVLGKAGVAALTS